MHTHSKEGFWKFVVGGVFKTQDFYTKYEPKLEFLGIWGSNQNTLHEKDMDNFWNNTSLLIYFFY